MDELTLFRGLRPDPPDLTLVQARTRARVLTGLSPDPKRPRRRRRLTLTLSVAAAAAVVTTVVPSVLFGGASASLVTPAYAVTRNGDGTVGLKIYDIAGAADAASLQRALHHEGVPAIVWFGAFRKDRLDNPICQAPQSNLEPEKVQYDVVKTVVNGRLVKPGDIDVLLLPSRMTPAERASLKHDTSFRFLIDPSAMPSGSVLYVRYILGTGQDNPEIGPPEVLKHAQAPC
jgi:hypothetical protein